MAQSTANKWTLKGTVLIACNCDYGCPCNFNALPTHGHCEGGWAWHVQEGRYGSTDLSGLTFSIAADWPRAIHDGNGEAAVLIDERTCWKLVSGYQFPNFGSRHVREELSRKLGNW